MGSYTYYKFNCCLLLQEMDDKLMTEAEFDQQLRVWTARVKGVSEGKLITGTHGTGHLVSTFKHYVDKMRDGDGRHLAYRFEPYGVFRAYGAGRGWVIVNGVPVPGRRVVSLKNLRNGSWRKLAEVKAMRKRGFLDRDIKQAKVTYDKHKGIRTPLDWLDSSISSHFNELADIAQEYFGDVALKSLANSIDKAKIIK